MPPRKMAVPWGAVALRRFGGPGQPLVHPGSSGGGHRPMSVERESGGIVLEDPLPGEAVRTKLREEGRERRILAPRGILDGHSVEPLDSLLVHERMFPTLAIHLEEVGPYQTVLPKNR